MTTLTNTAKKIANKATGEFFYNDLDVNMRISHKATQSLMEALVTQVVNNDAFYLEYFEFDLHLLQEHMTEEKEVFDTGILFEDNKGTFRLETYLISDVADITLAAFEEILEEEISHTAALRVTQALRFAFEEIIDMDPMSSDWDPTKAQDAVRAEN